jgi:hypothetical protein
MISNGIKAALAVAAFALASCSGTYWTTGNPTWVNLTGSDEVPPVTTNASGNGRFVVEPGGEIAGNIVVNGMSAGAAHIHVGAPGSNGPVIIALVKDANGFAAPAGAKLTAEQLVDLKYNRLYVNVHSAEHKGGEIRGQLRY